MLSPGLQIFLLIPTKKIKKTGISPNCASLQKQIWLNREQFTDEPYLTVGGSAKKPSSTPGSNGGGGGLDIICQRIRALP